MSERGYRSYVLEFAANRTLIAFLACGLAGCRGLYNLVLRPGMLECGNFGFIAADGTYLAACGGAGCGRGYIPVVN